MQLLSNRAHIRRTQRQLLRFVSSVVLAAGLLVLVNWELEIIAILLLVASKWQIVLGGPRLWLHNLWDNMVDIVFIASIVALLVLYAGDLPVQAGIIVLYLTWQLVIKPMSGVSGHGVQSIMALALASIVIFIFKEVIFGVLGMMVLMWLVAAAVADHFLISITDDVSLRKLLVAVWSLITVQVVWLLGRWQVFYTFFDDIILIPQATLVLLVLGYMFGAIYYDHYHKQLNRRRLYMYLGLITLVTATLIMGSEWVEQL